MKTLKLALYTTFITLILSSCGSEKSGNDIESFQVSKQSFQKFINQKSIDRKSNLTLDKSIVNNEYPIEMALYQDNRWYYNLPNLGEGTGTHTFENGKIQLIARRPLFDMYIEMKASDVEANQVHIEFRDRFGKKTLPMQNQNL